MFRTLAILLAMLVVTAVDGAGQAPASVAAARNEISTNRPNPHSTSAGGLSSGEDSAAEDELLAAANRSRKLAGSPPLRMDETLREAARAHAQLMVKSGVLEHELPGEAGLMQRIAQVSPLKMDRAGENIAYAPCATDVNASLMRSPPHRQNLLDAGFNVAGVAAVWSNGRLYVVQDFAREVPSYSTKQSTQVVSSTINEMRQQSGLPELAEVVPAKLDDAACSLAKQSAPNAHLLATAYGNRRIITYTQSRPEVLPQAAMNMLRDPNLRQFAVGSCYARNASYPMGTYWIAILLY